MVLARMLLAPIENVPFELVKTAVRLGGGNPLLIEQIVRIFFDQGVIALEADGEVAIDLDKLTRISLPMSVDDAVRARLMDYGIKDTETVMDGDKENTVQRGSAMAAAEPAPW